MVRWIKIGDTEGTARFDKELREKIVRFEIKIVTESSIPVDLDDEALEEYEGYLKDEILYAFEQWFEQFICERLEGNYDYQIEVLDEEEIPSIQIISTPSKEKGTLFLFVNPADLIDIVGHSLYKKLMNKLTRRAIDPDKIKLTFGD